MKMRSAPCISFITPVYNIRTYLPACVESILSQPFDAWEIILIDDKSTDGSQQLCDRYAAADTRVSVLHLPENVGPGPARNEGLSHAAGEYICFVDGDDATAAGELPLLWEAMGRCGYPDMMHVNYREIFAFAQAPDPAESCKGEEGVYGVDDFVWALLSDSRIGFYLWQFVIKREMVVRERLSFRPTLLGEDIDFVMRSLFAAKTIGRYGRTFYHWRTRLSGSLTSAHIACWEHLIASATQMLAFACRSSVTGPRKEWVLRNAHTFIKQFEAIAGAVAHSQVAERSDLFLPFEDYLKDLEEILDSDGLLPRIRDLGARDGAAAFCHSKAEEVRKLLSGVASSHLFGFPATRKCSRLMEVLAANGYPSKGLLDNDSRKQGLILDGQAILNPEIIPLCYGDGEGLFVVISTATKRTGIALADQLRGYGLQEGRHFICTGFDMD